MYILDVRLPECMDRHIDHDPPGTFPDGPMEITHIQGDNPFGQSVIGYIHLNRENPNPWINAQTPSGWSL